MYIYNLEIWITSTASQLVFCFLVSTLSSLHPSQSLPEWDWHFIITIWLRPHLHVYPTWADFLWLMRVRRALEQQGPFYDSSQHPCLSSFSITTPGTQRLQLHWVSTFFLHTPSYLVVSATLHMPFPLLGCPFMGRVMSKLCLLMPSECCLTMVLQAILKMENSVK